MTRKSVVRWLLTVVFVFLFLLVLISIVHPREEIVPVSIAGTATTAVLDVISSPTNPVQIEAKMGPLFVNPDNPRYFTDGTKENGKYRAVYLTGSHTWCDFMDCGSSNPPPAFDYSAFLDFLSTYNFNFFRLWRAENSRGGENGDNFWFTPMPYMRSSTECCAFDGGNKFDLNQFNNAYFDRMRQRLIQAGQHGIYVSIMLFDGWSVESKFVGHDPWKGHPYNVQNNVNGVDGDVNHDGQGSETHTLVSSQITALQERYVRKVLDTINDLDNVLYEISNESSPGSEEWQYHIIDYIKTYEASKPKQHPVGMTVELGGSNEDLLDSRADWISPNGYVNNPIVADGSKVILADTDHLCGLCGNEQTVWKSFTRGENPIFMDPYDGVQIGRGAPQGYDRNNANDMSLRLNLGFTRDYAERMNLVLMSPRPDLCSTEYCLANPITEGAQYLIFLPTGGTVDNFLYGLKVPSILHKLRIDTDISIDLRSDSVAKVDLSKSPGELTVEWFNPSEGTITDGGKIQGGKTRLFTAPFSGDAVLYIYDPSP